MKKLLLALAGIVALLLVTWSVAWGFAFHAEGKADRAFAEIAPDAALASSYPLVAAKNESAARLEDLTPPFGVDIRPRTKVENPSRPELDAATKQAISDWLTAQHERPDDTIEPLPENLRSWLDANRAQIDAAATLLAGADTPRWPQREGAPQQRLEQPIPNLLGHMHLFKIFSVAALERASSGDHAGAWERLHAAWKLDRGLRERRELISELIAVAGVKLIAASARKLEPPAPPWFAELSERRFSDGIYDAIRFESATIAAAVKEAPTADLAATPLLEGAPLWPAIRWAVAENNRALHELLPSFAAATACSADSGTFAAQLRSAVPDLAANIGVMNEHVPNAIWRGAHADLVIEGTNRIIALKAARAAAGGAWPQTFAEETSTKCPGERWAYSVTPEGPMLQFTSALTYPEAFVGTKIPMEYRGAATDAK